MCEKYNGWSNYYTWVYKDWIDRGRDVPLNNEIFCLGSYNYWREEAKVFKKNDDVRGFEELLGEKLLEAADVVLPGESCLADLLRHAIESINFKEIAEYMMDKLDGLTDDWDEEEYTDDWDDFA